eukprot:jgi/Psemu1/7710/gm1.7710_g
MSMTSLLAQEEERAFVLEATELDIFQRLPDSSLGTNYNNNNNNNDARDSMVMRSNKLNKGHICLKWNSATKAQSAPELVKRINPGYGWKIEVVRDPTIEEAYLSNTLDWLVAPLPPKYKDDNNLKQDWFMGIYMQLMTNHCPEWVDNEPTCATSFVSMEFPIFAMDTEDMEASAPGPAQVPSTAKPLGIAKATNIRALQKAIPLRAWRRSYFNNQMQR